MNTLPPVSFENYRKPVGCIGNTWLRISMLSVLFVGGIPSSPALAVNLLFYGNSFTLGSGSTDSVPNLVRDIATAAGQATPTVVNAAVSGQNFSWHLANNTSIISSGLPVGQQWDYAVMQNFSTAPTYIGDLTQHRSDSVALYQTIASHSAAVTPVLFETWARAPGHSFYTGSNPSFPGGPAQMQQEVRDGYELARQDIDAVTIPGLTRVAEVGDRWEDAAWNNLHAGDLYHAQNRGTLLAALEIYSTVYQDDTSDIDLTGVLGGLNLSSSDGTFLTSIVDGTDPPDPPISTSDLTLKFNFGDTVHPDPNYNVVAWNNQNIADANDFTTGQPTGISLTLTSATGLNEAGPNNSGTVAPGAPASDFFDGPAAETNLFGHDSNFNVGAPRPMAEYTLSGFNPNRTYDFTFFASRLGAGDNRETQYDVSGLNAGVDFLDAAENTSGIAQVLDIQPTATGEIVLTLQKGPNNTNSSGFFYLGALDITADPLPTGDYNGDGVVDTADYTAWVDAFGDVGSSPEDGNGDGQVDAADYTVWRDAYDAIESASNSTAVPEPGTMSLVALSLFLLSKRTVRQEEIR